MKNIHVIAPENTSEPIELPLFNGNQMFYAPRPKLTTASATAFVSSADNDITDAAIPVLNNMRTRINELEAVLIKLGLLKAQ